jgi:hypothetical protein
MGARDRLIPPSVSSYFSYGPDILPEAWLRPSPGKRYNVIIQMADSKMLSALSIKHPKIWMCLSITTVVAELIITLRAVRFEDWFETHLHIPRRGYA